MMIIMGVIGLVILGILVCKYGNSAVELRQWRLEREGARTVTK